MTPGLYNISAGQAEVNPDGSIIFHRLKLRPAPLPPPVINRSLQDRWQDDNQERLTFAKFRSELIRMNYLSEHDSKLNMTGKQVRSLYRFLSIDKVIEPCGDMVEVYAAFSGDFKMKFKGAGSLTRMRDLDEDLNFWRKTFAFCLPDTNATDYDE